VARFELISATPILPKMAVSAAKTADPNANNRQSKFMRRLCARIAHDRNCARRDAGHPCARIAFNVSCLLRT
jgi:hypothetical protein